MPTYSLTWLADVLRAAGLKVEEQPGWQSRGRGPFGKPRGVILHHTAGAAKGNYPSLAVVRDGRGPPKPLPGPLSQLGLGRDGTWFVIAAGRTNHAGEGIWQGVTNGNSEFIGVEAENTGVGQAWPAVQLDSNVRGVAAILKHIKALPIMAAGHREYALPKGRKIDPAGIDMNDFRKKIGAIMNLPPEEPKEDDPTPGKRVKVSGVVPDTLAFRDAPDGRQIGSLPEDEIVTVIGESGKWTEVETRWTKSRGFVASRFLVAA